MTHYRAKLVLEEVTPFQDANGYTRENSSAIATIDVTGGTPGSAMAQAVRHAVELSDFHRDIKAVGA
jgi:hypothetical protein